MKFSFRKVLVAVVVSSVVSLGLASKFSVFAATNEEPAAQEVVQHEEAAQAQPDIVSVLESLVAGANPADPDSLNAINSQLVHGDYRNIFQQVKDKSAFTKSLEGRAFDNSSEVSEEMRSYIKAKQHKSAVAKAIMRVDLGQFDCVWCLIAGDVENGQMGKLLDNGQPRANLKADLVNEAGEIIFSNDLTLAPDKGAGYHDVAAILVGFLPKGKLSSDSKLRLNVVDKVNGSIVEAFEINAKLRPFGAEKAN